MLRIIGIFILIYIFFRILVGIIIPWALRTYLKKQREKYYNENTSRQKQSRQYKKDDINISVDEEKSSTQSDNIGEYVDYEDIPTEKNKEKE